MPETWPSLRPEAISLRWKTFAVVGAPVPPMLDNLVFKVAPARGLVRQFGADPRRSYVPHVLLPTKTFHQRVLREIGRDGEAPPASRLPVQVRLMNDLRGRLNVGVHVFPPGLVCITQSIDQLEGVALGFEALASLNRRDTHPILHRVVRATLAQLGVDTRQVSARVTRSFPAMQIRLPTSGEEFADTVTAHRRELVSLLIHHKAPNSMNAELVDEIWQKNATHNRKSRFESLLANKQGMVLVRPHAEAHDPVFELNKAHDLAEIALSFEAFLEELPSLRLAYPAYAGFLLERAGAWITQPGSQLHRTVSYQMVFELLRDELQLKANLPADHAARPEPGDRAFVDSFADEWWSDPEFYEVIEDATSARENLGLEFVDDAALRQVLARDVREAKRSRDARNHKAAMVLAGSVLEAALLAAILKVDGAGAATLKTLGLKDLFDEATSRRVIAPSDDIVHNIDTIAAFRNLIHPGREIRKGIVPDEHRATISIATMELVLKEIDRSVRRRPE